MSLTLLEAAARIDRILSAHRRGAQTGHPLLRAESGAGKVYEAWVLADVLKRLVLDEGYVVTLRDGNRPRLKSSPGPINRAYPHFDAVHPLRPTLEVWTDIEFLTLSYRLRGGTWIARSDHHELDIVVVETARDSEYPAHDEIRIGVECKNTGYSKEHLRAILGVRRELSLLRDPTRTGFLRWPRRDVPAEPPSCLLVYGTDLSIRILAPPDDVFGINFVHLPPP